MNNYRRTWRGPDREIRLVAVTGIREGNASQEQIQTLPGRTNKTARCMYPQEHHRCDEPVDVVVTTKRATLHFCIYHKAYALTMAVVNAMTRGRVEIFISDFGRFEMKLTEACVDPSDEDADDADDEAADDEAA